jgi:chromosome segregation ATPase
VIATTTPVHAATTALTSAVQTLPSDLELAEITGITGTVDFAALDSYNTQVQLVKLETTQQEAEQRQLLTELGAYNTTTDTYNSESAAANAAADRVNAQLATVGTEIDEHNAQPHDFELPDQEAAYIAYENQANQLNAEQSQLNSEADAVNEEQSRLEQEESLLGTEKEQLASAMEAHNAKDDALQTRSDAGRRGSPGTRLRRADRPLPDLQRGLPGHRP